MGRAGSSRPTKSGGAMGASEKPRPAQTRSHVAAGGWYPPLPQRLCRLCRGGYQPPAIPAQHRFICGARQTTCETHPHPSGLRPSTFPPSRGKVSGARVTAPAKENVPSTVILRPQAEESVPLVLGDGRETRGRGKRILRFAQDDTGVGAAVYFSSSLRTAMASKQSPLPLVSAWRRKPGPLPCFSFSRRTRCAGLRREAACGGKLFTPRPA